MRHTAHASRWLAAAALLLFVAGCATGPRITAEADPRADFSRFSTFAFYSPLAVESEGYETPTSRAMRAAVRRELEARGYRYLEGEAAKPDLWVNINAYIERRTGVTSTPYVDYGYYYSYRARRYYAVPFWGERVDTYRYTEGTVNVDLVDVGRNALVWEGIAVGRAANLQAEERDARIGAVMADIFARYPYRAGSAQGSSAM